jgi:hypothetical protein
MDRELDLIERADGAERRISSPWMDGWCNGQAQCLAN